MGFDKSMIPPDFLIDFNREEVPDLEIEPSFFIRGSSYFGCKNEETAALAEKTGIDLGILQKRDSDSHSRLLNILNQTFQDCSSTILSEVARHTFDLFYFFSQNPLIDLESITQIHDAAEELTNNTSLETSICKIINAAEDRVLNDSSPDIFTKEVSWQERSLKYYKNLSRAANGLKGAKSKLVQDIKSILNSIDDPNSPIYHYIKILEAKQVNIFGNVSGHYSIKPVEKLETTGVNISKNYKSLNDLLYRSHEGAVCRRLVLDCLALLNYSLGVSKTSRLCWKRPYFNSESIVEIKEGYHPEALPQKGIYCCEDKIALYKTQMKSIVRNDLLLDRNKKISIQSGINEGGKSTSIRMAGLVSLMAQMGMFVPADRANLPIYSEFLTHFNITDNLSSGLSTFAAERNNFEQVLKHNSGNALMMFDELFRGTEYSVSKHMIPATVMYLLDDVKVGKVFLATHFHEAIRSLENEKRISFLEVQTNKSGNPTFKIAPGITQGGYARQVIERSNLPSALIAKSQKFYEEKE